MVNGLQDEKKIQCKLINNVRAYNETVNKNTLYIEYEGILGYCWSCEGFGLSRKYRDFKLVEFIA